MMYPPPVFGMLVPRDYMDQKPAAYMAFLRHVRRTVEGFEVDLGDKMCMDHHVSDLFQCLETWFNREFGNPTTTGHVWRLARMNLARNGLSDESTARIVETLKLWDVRIQRLDLKCNAAGHRAVTALSEYIWNCPEPLAEVSLEKNKITVASLGDGRDPISALLRTLYNHPAYPRKVSQNEIIHVVPLILRLSDNAITAGGNLLDAVRNRGGRDRVRFCTTGQPYESLTEEYLSVYLPEFGRQGSDEDEEHSNCQNSLLGVNSASVNCESWLPTSTGRAESETSKLCLPDSNAKSRSPARGNGAAELERLQLDGANPKGTDGRHRPSTARSRVSPAQSCRRRPTSAPTREASCTASEMNLPSRARLRRRDPRDDSTARRVTLRRRHETPALAEVEGQGFGRRNDLTSSHVPPTTTCKVKLAPREDSLGVEDSLSAEEQRILQDDVAKLGMFDVTTDPEARKMFAEFVVCTLMMGKGPSEATREFRAFIGDEAEAFVAWLSAHLIDSRLTERKLFRMWFKKD